MKYNMHISKLRTRLRRNLGTILLLTPVLFILFGYVLYPSIRTLWQSFSLKNYEEFFNLGQRANLEALFNSLFIALGSVILSALVGVPLAFIFTRYRFPGRDLFSSLAILPLFIPPL